MLMWVGEISSLFTMHQQNNTANMKIIYIWFGFRICNNESKCTERIVYMNMNMDQQMKNN